MLKNLILLLPCFVCLHSAITLFISRKKNFRSQNIWMLCMFFTSVTSFIWGIYYRGDYNYSLYYKLDIIDAAFSLTFFPFVCLYFRSLTDATPIGRKEYCWFLPGLLIGLSSLLIYVWMGDAQAAEYICAVNSDYVNIEKFNSLVYKLHFVVNVILFYFLLVLQQILALKYTINHLINYRRRLDDFLSNPDEKSLDNIKAILMGIFALIIVFFLFFIEGFILFHRYPLVVYLLIFAYAIVLYYLDYHISRVKYTAIELEKTLLQIDGEAERYEYAVINENSREVKPVLIIKKERREELLKQMNYLLNEDKIFLKKDLRLDDVVRLTKVNRTYISKFIGEEYQCSFSELINNKRIAYAQKRTLANPKISHSHIAEESGFVHASSFSRTFKQYVGITYKEWCKENLTE